jgi:hypothetical protein
MVPKLLNIFIPVCNRKCLLYIFTLLVFIEALEWNSENKLQNCWSKIKLSANVLLPSQTVWKGVQRTNSIKRSAKDKQYTKECNGQTQMKELKDTI